MEMQVMKNWMHKTKIQIVSIHNLRNHILAWDSVGESNTLAFKDLAKENFQRLPKKSTRIRSSTFDNDKIMEKKKVKQMMKHPNQDSQKGTTTFLYC